MLRDLEVELLKGIGESVPDERKGETLEDEDLTSGLLGDDLGDKLTNESDKFKEVIRGTVGLWMEN